MKVRGAGRRYMLGVASLANARLSLAIRAKEARNRYSARVTFASFIRYKTRPARWVPLDEAPPSFFKEKFVEKIIEYIRSRVIWNFQKVLCVCDGANVRR